MRQIRPILALVITASLVLSACGEDEPAQPATPTTAAPTTASTTAAPSTTAAENAPGYSTNDVSTPASKSVSFLKDVRAANQPNGDRVTFEFDGDLPGYTIKYITPPLVADGSGEPVTIAGNAILQVVFQQASGVDLTGGYKPTYTGPPRFTPSGTTTVEEVVRSGDFEAVLSWGIGLKAKAGFAVSTLSSPSRIVIDFQK